MGTSSFSITHRTTASAKMRAFVAISAIVGISTAQYLPYAAGPAIAAAPYAPYAPSSQFQAQDEFGNLNYGYANLNSAKTEVGNTYAGVTGGYSYVDANGLLQKVEYIADGAGFRVADSRLPVFNPDLTVAPTFNPEPLVAPTFNPELPVAPVYTGVAPEPVEDTPEVAEAKAAHAAALEAAAAAAADRKKREADPAILAGASRIISAPTPLIHNPPVRPIVHHAAYVAPYAGLGYHGLGLGYAGLGYTGLH